MSPPAAAESPGEDPRGTYLRRADERARDAKRHERLHHALGYARLATIAGTLLIAWMAFRGAGVSFWLLLAPAAILVLLSRAHDGVLARRDRLARAAEHYRRGVERIDGRWAGAGETGEAHGDLSHPYGADLDLFGRGSLFELLCAARTHSGQEVLASWLREPAAPSEIRLRQEAVAELKGRLDLREDLALLSSEAREGVDSEPLARWAAQPVVLRSTALRAGAPLLAAATVTAVGGWALAGWSIVPAAVMVIVQGVVGRIWRGRVLEVITAVERASRDLGILSGVLARLEGESFASAKLAGLARSLRSGGIPPSRRIARLARLVELLDSRRNQLFALVAPLLLWATQIAFALEAWRERTGGAVGEWLRAVGEIEALSSLAGYAFEHPRDPFPAIEEQGPIFDARGLGHPLIREADCVRNDLRLGGGVKLLVVSGSNMSGKSTLLRSVGANTVLALAGAPVRAEALRISPLRLGASIRNVDSLLDGKSRFYAEITRLKQIISLAGDGGTVLYLLDELLSGTNSHDRKLGAEGVVRGLVERGAVGLLTTHDLALTQIAEAMDGAAANVHFEDRIEGGEIRFDYRLREGVVRRGNALELMRAVGIRV